MENESEERDAMDWLLDDNVEALETGKSRGRGKYRKEKRRQEATRGEGAECTRTCGITSADEEEGGGKVRKRKVKGWSTEVLEEVECKQDEVMDSMNQSWRITRWKRPKHMLTTGVVSAANADIPIFFSTNLSLFLIFPPFLSGTHHTFYNELRVDVFVHAVCLCNHFGNALHEQPRTDSCSSRTSLRYAS